MKAKEKVIRMSCIPYKDEKPIRHTWYLYDAKVGTGPHTIIWVANKKELNIGDEIYFVDDFDKQMNNKKVYVQYLSESSVKKGIITDVNDYLAFVSLL